ncbi:ABC transporter substrate-binding protein [Salinisphaera sp. PC39]|uniref:ABC transporter substrate-binding protein n=1 Tax=Salinisphaera sp. PC39 TaxID=1304156 RepID=UPI00333FF991
MAHARQRAAARAIVGLVAALMLPGTPVHAAPSEAAAAADTVRDFYERVERMTRLDSCAERAAFLESAVDSTYDIPNYLRESLRGHWQELAGEDVDALQRGLRHLIATTYAANFASPEDLSVRIGDAAYEDRYRRSVGVLIQQSGKEVAQRRYLLHRTDDGGDWKVINLFFPRGGNELVHRARYNEENLRWGGFDALREYLRAEASRFGADC